MLSRVATPAQLMSELKKYSLEGLAEKITAKTLVIDGEPGIRPGQGAIRCTEVPEGLPALHGGRGSPAPRADRFAGGADP